MSINRTRRPLRQFPVLLFFGFIALYTAFWWPFSLILGLLKQESRPTVMDKQSPLTLRPWVFLFGIWQEHLQRLGNAGKPVFRVYWTDWHEPISLKLNIYHFEPQNFGGHPKQLAKNPEKCANDSFFKGEDDPTNTEQFIRAVRQIYSV